MRRIFERIFKKYGALITLRGEEGDQKVYGIMQHTGSLGWQNMQPVFSPLGEVLRGQYLLLLPMEPALQKGDMFSRGDVWYVIRRIESVWHGKETVYRWCLCEEGGETGVWGSQS